MPTVQVWVDVELDEFDSEDLRDELERRGKSFDHDDTKTEIEEMYYAFKLGKTDRALELARKICQDVTGKFLA